MTRRVSRHGTAYTEGSSSTAPPEYPRVCERCTKPIRVSKESFEQRADHTPAGLVFRSWHIACR